ncbi:MAG: GNAT family N-acetyltransferase, partial [Actinomycetota bacterium]|nr:GNAT family N-acetyltransferase [Actinomycetota bacterium]
FWSHYNDLELELLASSGDPPTPLSMAAIEGRFDKKIAEPEPDYWFTIEVDDRVIGDCALMRFDQTARTCTLGIVIGERDYWGKGYGRDAVSTLVDYGFRHLNMHRIWLSVLASNERAIRSYESCGFREEVRLRRHIWVDGTLRDEVMMGLLRAEWPGLAPACSLTATSS